MQQGFLSQSLENLSGTLQCLISNTLGYCRGIDTLAVLENTSVQNITKEDYLEFPVFIVDTQLKSCMRLKLPRCSTVVQLVEFFGHVVEEGAWGIWKSMLGVSESC